MSELGVSELGALGWRGAVGDRGRRQRPQVRGGDAGRSLVRGRRQRERQVRLRSRLTTPHAGRPEDELVHENGGVIDLVALVEDGEIDGVPARGDGCLRDEQRRGPVVDRAGCFRSRHGRESRAVDGHGVPVRIRRKVVGGVDVRSRGGPRRTVELGDERVVVARPDEVRILLGQEPEVDAQAVVAHRNGQVELQRRDVQRAVAAP